MLVSIVPVEEHLYRRYEGQSNPQRAYVELVPQTGAFTAAVDAEVSGNVPGEVAFRVVLRWGLTSQGVSADAANKLLEELEELAQRVVDGHTVTWDGHNHVGHLSAGAEAASQKIRDRCEELQPDVDVWNAEDYCAGIGSHGVQRTSLGIDGTTTGPQLRKIARKLLEEATLAGSGVTIIEGLEHHLKNLRDDAPAHMSEGVKRAKRKAG